MTLYSTGVLDRVSQQVSEGKLYKCINFEIFGVKKIVKFEGRDLLTE